MWPEPRAAMPAESARASTIGARRLTASAASSSSTLNELSRPLAGQRGVRDEHVGVADLGQQPRDLVRPREVAGDRAARQLGRQRLEHVGAAAGQHEPRARARRRARDRVPDAPGRPGEQDRAPAEVHRAKTATVAVKLCRKYSPPTGPISPAAKNPAAGAPASSAAIASASWSGLPNMPEPRPLQANTSAPAGAAAAERLHPDPERPVQVAVGARGVAGVQAHDLARVAPRCRRRPRRSRGPRRRARAPGSRPARSRACWRRPRSPSAARRRRGRGPPAESPSIASRSLESAGLPASSPMMWPSAAVIVSSGPIGAAPCETHGSTSMPSRRTPTAPPSTTSSPKNSAGPSSGVRAEASAAEQRQQRRRLGEEAQDGVGRERERVGEQDRARGARRGRAGPTARRNPPRAPRRSRGTAAPRRRRARRPTPTPRCPSSISRASLITPPAPQPIRLVGVEHLVDGAERRLRRGEVRAGREHHARGRRSACRARAPPPRPPPARRRARRAWSRGRWRCGRCTRLTILPRPCA